MDTPPIPLILHTYTSVSPDRVRHWTDEGWSSFDYGDSRVQVKRTDLTMVKAARALAQTAAAELAMWDRDLAALEAQLTAEEDAASAVPPQTPEPRPDPAAAPDPNPFDEPDVALDKQVEKVATMPETHRRTIKKES